MVVKGTGGWWDRNLQDLGDRSGLIRFARFGVDEFSGVCEDGGFEAERELESGGGDSGGG